MMLEAGIIPKDYKDDGQEFLYTSPDSYLGNKGWMKIHGDWILFEGYDEGHEWKEDNSPTDAQLKELYRYGQNCCAGSLKLGYSKHHMSAVNIEKVNKVQLRMKYFKL